MPDISRITLPTGTTYTLKDEVAREAASGAIHILGTTTTALAEDSTTNPIQVDGKSVTAKANDAVFYQKRELVFDGTKWHEFGDMSGLGDLATKDSASGSFTPAGTVSAPTITVTPETETAYVSGSATGGGAVTAGTAAACTLPVLTTSVVDETLTLSWSAGSFTANTPTQVTLPTFQEKTVVTGIDSADATQPSFTGTPGAVTVS